DIAAQLSHRRAHIAHISDDGVVPVKRIDEERGLLKGVEGDSDRDCDVDHRVVVTAGKEEEAVLEPEQHPEVKNLPEIERGPAGADAFVGCEENEACGNEVYGDR